MTSAAVVGNKVAVLGAGAWGTALAKVLADKGDSVQMYQTASCATVVAGGSDERPNTRSDQRLARHRVKSVCQYLLRHGIMEARMKAVRIGAPVSVFSHTWRDARRRRPRVEACRQP